MTTTTKDSIRIFPSEASRTSPQEVGNQLPLRIERGVDQPFKRDHEDSSTTA
jgi:hypothetical protein